VTEEGTKVAGFQLESELGSGPFGRVWTALDPEGAAVVVKLLRPELTARADLVESFRWVQAAVQLHGRIEHPYVARGLGVIMVPEAGHYGVVSERSPGRSLARLAVSRAAQDGDDRVELARLLFLFEELGEGLFWIHRAGMVHGNLKPTNVIVQRGDFGLVPRIVDLSWSALGIAATADGASVAPEQFAGQAPTAASDQWAYGTLITRLLTSKRDDRSFGAVPDRLVDVLARCRGRTPAERFGSMREAIDQLRMARAELERREEVQKSRFREGSALRRPEPPVPSARTLTHDSDDVPLESPAADRAGPRSDREPVDAPPSKAGGARTPPRAEARAVEGRPATVTPRAPAAAPDAPTPDRPWDVQVDDYDFRPKSPLRLVGILMLVALVAAVGALLWVPVMDLEADGALDPAPAGDTQKP